MVSSVSPLLEWLGRPGSVFKTLTCVLVFGLGALLLHNGLLGPAGLLGLFGLALGVRLAWPLPTWRRRAPMLALCLGQLGILAAALWLLARPLPGGWQRLDGTRGWSDPTLLLTGDGVLVVVASSPKNSFWSEDGGRSFRPRGLPGPFGLALADDDRRGWIWVGAAHGNALAMFDRGKGRWLHLPRPTGHLWGLTLSEDRVFLALGLNGLKVTADGEQGFRSVPGIDHCNGVGAAPDDEQRMLAVGRAWFSSSDGGRHWMRITSSLEDRFAHPAVALGGGGWSYVYEGGMLSGALAVAGPGQSRFELRRLPASNVRVIVADAEDGSQVWLGSWGQGVFSSQDGGRSWRNLGLNSIEVRSLVVDPRHHRVFAASSNLLLRRGVYVRTLATAPSDD